MNKLLRVCCSAPLALLAALPLASQAQESTSREDLYYVGVLATALNHRSVGEDTVEATWSNAGTLVFGGHITDLFHAEVRVGAGISEGTVDGLLNLNIDHFESWYMGLHYPLTDYANIYGQAGFSNIHGRARLTQEGQAIADDPDRATPYEELVGEYPESAFSISWIVGLDMELFNNAYVVLEGGRLFKDTGTNANTFQFSSGLRYEF
ncbi:outer membrane beta-barrel protein [Marinobacter zhejiangensis]|uniref:Outer membrane protein beta-barrel domain-containing protein n=1 Tax=Marinobacter zhejiangensis TaxID=488535 RepID=A0A1I4P0I6_9GAMM|nr:outer membrane beta-barrel protein [Marinobacter zhejiangensis]SFM20893.1 Outer membrane protein beta-barrel domain-containing protein [Marinobacter zhejiangensis]